VKKYGTLSLGGIFIEEVESAKATFTPIVKSPMSVPNLFWGSAPGPARRHSVLDLFAWPSHAHFAHGLLARVFLI
jgi:hypothetical protein